MDISLAININRVDGAGEAGDSPSETNLVAWFDASDINDGGAQPTADSTVTLWKNKALTVWE